MNPDDRFVGLGRLLVCGEYRQVEVQISRTMAVVENVALDEAMTRTAAADGRWRLRLWWGSDPTVVVGYSEKPEDVANLEACRRLGVEVIKRSSGGGTVLQTRGVLNYSVVGPSPTTLNIRSIFNTSAYLLIGALGRLGVRAEARGISDVAVENRKISGNAMARRWGGLLLHGTLLWDMDFELLESCLRHPPREPDYRQGRSHRAFLVTLKELGVAANRSDLERAFLQAVGVEG